MFLVNWTFSMKDLPIAAHVNPLFKDTLVLIDTTSFFIPVPFDTFATEAQHHRANVSTRYDSNANTTISGCLLSLSFTI
jgi:hypothetical protein